MSSGRISRATRRKVFARDCDQCTYVDEHGNRCPARARLELDHVLPKAHGGTDDPANVRVRCRAHNLWYAEQAFGRAHVAERTHRRQEQSRQRATAAQKTANAGSLSGAFRAQDPDGANRTAAPGSASRFDDTRGRRETIATESNGVGGGNTINADLAHRTDTASNEAERTPDRPASRSSDNNTDEALFVQATKALGHLGFRPSDVRRAVEEVRGRQAETPVTVELILRRALAILT